MGKSRVWLGACAAMFLSAQAFAIGILAPTEAGLPPLEIVRHEATVTIENQVAKTKVTQVFHNSYPRQLEANYLFPTPKGAQITDFTLFINGQPVKGEMMDQREARAVYEDIVRRMRDPGLVEYMDRDLFRIRIFPIPANGDQKVEIEFAQALELNNGAAQYTYPARTVGRPGSVLPDENFSFHFNVKSEIPIKSVYSPSHTLTYDREGEKQVKGETRKTSGSSQRDVTLVIGFSKDDIGLSVVTRRDDPDKDGYFLAMISPKVDYKDTEILPKAMTFVFDTSGSMQPDGKMEQARKALLYCIGTMKDKDYFNIVRFSSDIDSFRDELVPADKDNRDRAKRWIEELAARGGTNIDGALQKALDFTPPKGLVHTIVMMTDGLPTMGESNPTAIQKNVANRNTANLRVFTFGVGYDVNTRLLDGIAEDTRAASEYIKPEEDIEASVSEFYDKVSNPVLTDLALEIDGVKTRDLYPTKLPDMFAGGQLLVFGRYTGNGDANVTLKGKLGDKAQTFGFKAAFPKEEPEHEYIENLWATRKVGYLLEEIRRNGENKEVVDEVVTLAKKYAIVTPYTSFLAVEEQELAQANANLGRGGDQFRDLAFNRAPGSAAGLPPPGGIAGRRGGGGGSFGGGGRRGSEGQGGQQGQQAAAAPAVQAPGDIRAAEARSRANASVSTPGDLNRLQLPQLDAAVDSLPGAAAPTPEPIAGGTAPNARAGRGARGGAGGAGGGRGGGRGRGAAPGAVIGGVAGAGAGAIIGEAQSSGDKPAGADLKAQSGEAAVAASKSLEALQSASADSKKDASASQKTVAGKTYKMTEGVWVEESLADTSDAAKEKNKDLKTIKVKFLSEAYFELVKLRPDLKEAFGLGEKVKVRLGAKLAVEIGETGDEKLSADNAKEITASLEKK